MVRVPSLLAAAAATVLLAAGCGGTVSPTPTHVTAEFFDGVNTGNYVETCEVWRAAVGHLRQCTAYLVERGAFFGLGNYRVVGHSYVGWKEGRVSVARVTVTSADGAVLHVWLVKTAKHGWLVVQVS